MTFSDSCIPLELDLFIFLEIRVPVSLAPECMFLLQSASAWGSSHWGYSYGSLSLLLLEDQVGELWGLKTILTVFFTFYSRAVSVAEFSWRFAPCLPSIIGSVCHRLMAVGNFVGSASHSSTVEKFTLQSLFLEGFHFCLRLGVGVNSLLSHLLMFSVAGYVCHVPYNPMFRISVFYLISHSVCRDAQLLF